MAIQKLITTAGLLLIANALAGTDNLTGMTVVFGSGRTAPAVDDTGVETALNPARLFSADYAAVSSTGNFQTGISDNVINDSSGSGGSDYTGSEIAVMKGSVCVSRAVETDASANIVVKPPNASYALNIVHEIDNPSSGTVTVDVTNYNGLADVGIPGRVPFNTDDEFAQRASGLIVPKTSQIPAKATANDITNRSGEAFVPASLLPVFTPGLIFVPPSSVAGTNAIVLVPSPRPASLAIGLAYRFIAPATVTNVATLQVILAAGNLANSPVKELRIDGVQAGAAHIVHNKIYDVVYDGTAWEVLGSNTEFIDHSHFIAPVVLSEGSGSVAWDVAAAPIGRVTLTGNRSLTAFTNGVSGGFYELIVTASGGKRTLVFASQYDRGDTIAPSPVDVGDTSLLMFQMVGTQRLYVGERTGYSV